MNFSGHGGTGDDEDKSGDFLMKKLLQQIEGSNQKCVETGCTCQKQTSGCCSHPQSSHKFLQSYS